MIISLWGWYGHHNYGDDLMLLNSIKRISDNVNNAKILLYSKDKMDFLNGYHVVIHNRNIRECLKGCFKSDAFIWNGGTGLPHKNNAKILFLLLISLIMRIRRKKFILLGFGVGDSTLKNMFSFSLFKLLIRMSSLFTCRQMGISKYIQVEKYDNMFLTSDMAFCSFEQKPIIYCNPRQSNVIGISLADVFDNSEHKFKITFFNQISLIVKALGNKGYNVCFVSFAQKDNLLNEKIARSTKVGFVKYDDKPASFYKNILEMHLIIAMRFHAIVTALNYSIPICSISYSEKGADLMKIFDFEDFNFCFGTNYNEYWGIKKNISCNEILSIVKRIENNYEEVQNKIKRILPKILDNSTKNYSLLFQTLNKQN